MGEGGAILIRMPNILKMQIIREKGTNRSNTSEVRLIKYTWVNYGSSYLPSDMNAYSVGTAGTLWGDHRCQTGTLEPVQ